MTATTRSLIPHDGLSETFVCRSCLAPIDPVGGNYPGYTKQQCDRGECPHCGGTDTAWLFAVEQDHGTLHDYATGLEIRPATRLELKDSREAAKHDGGAGVIDVGGRSCYVQE